MALEMQNFEALSPPVVKKITWWTLLHTIEFVSFPSIALERFEPNQTMSMINSGNRLFVV